jgi:hypothetical protein
LPAVILFRSCFVFGLDGEKSPRGVVVAEWGRVGNRCGVASASARGKVFLLLFFKKEESSFSEEKEAKRLLVLRCFGFCAPRLPGGTW